MNVYGNLLLENQKELDFDYLKKIISRPSIKPRFRVSVLHPDEQVNYIIPNEDIVQNGISYTEDYANGKRRTLSLKLINIDGRYTPNINGIWLQSRFKLEVGIVTPNKEIIWFPKGIYIVGDTSFSYNDSSKEVTYSLQDKFSTFEGKLGTLEDGYEIPVGSSIQEAVKGILNFSRGDGYIMDYMPPLFDPKFENFRTQSTIRVQEGGSLSQVIEELATQLSAEYYYNNIGNLCFYPINDTTNDQGKSIIWTFSENNSHYNSVSINYKNSEVVNAVKVVGNNVDYGVYSHISENKNPRSPICIQQIGRRAAPTYSEANVWSEETARDLADYYLRKSSILPVEFSCTVNFNPLLTVNNICQFNNQFLQFRNQKFLLTSISYNSPDASMSVKMCNIEELPFS